MNVPFGFVSIHEMVHAQRVVHLVNLTHYIIAANFMLICTDLQIIIVLKCSFYKNFKE